MYEWIAKVTADRQACERWARWCGLLPRSVMATLCRMAALLLYSCAASGLRRKVQGNMKELLPERSAQQIRKAGFRYTENVIFALYEILLESHRLSGSEKWRFRTEGEAYLEEALRLGRGAIVYTPHAGNFFYYYWYLCQKYSCLTVATGGSSELRPLYLKFLDMGCPGLDYDSTPPLELLRKLRKHLQAGGVVFLLGDFWRPTFPPARFFGRMTRTPEGASTLSIEQGVPIIPFSGWRERGWVHRMRFEAPLYLSSSFTKATRAEATNVLNRFMERVIRERPEQWFYWFNAEERWETEQGGGAGVHTEQERRKTHTA
ncbi:lysophospholipid acyltransferase family protein [Paenibacillus elgii]|uniref:lysophospholipid acyltransferase family protein n=1 Tax=Paenibacillus elgii TaxID=189691 RepID=UPI000248C1B6|nr:lysophospholipid acyltransferase family protein [Paenibacillus elgii]